MPKGVILKNLSRIKNEIQYHEPSGFCSSSRNWMALAMEWSISVLLCFGYNFLKRASACMADPVHSMYLFHKTAQFKKRTSWMNSKVTTTFWSLWSYSISIRVSSKNSVGLNFCRTQDFSQSLENVRKS